MLNNYDAFLSFYSTPLVGTGYLAFRDIPEIIRKQGEVGSVLDFGCSSGRSTQMLSNLGLKVTLEFSHLSGY